MDDLEILQEKEVLIEDPMSLYVPLDKLLPLHNSLSKGRAIFGANRTGKTTWGVSEAVLHSSLNYDNLLWDYDPKYRFTEPTIGRIIVRDFSKAATEVLEPELNKWLSRQDVKRMKKNPQGYLVKVELQNGSRFDIMTQEQDLEQFEGWHGHWAWFDEPIDRDRFIATLRGLVDFNGRWFMTCTPLSQAWMYDQIYTNPDVESVTMDIEDNCREHSNGFLTHESIEEYAKNLTIDEKEARLHGKFMHLSGLVYKEFKPSEHIIPPFEIPSDWTHYMVIDPHDRKPFALVWAAVDHDNNVFLYDEYPEGPYHELIKGGRTEHNVKKYADTIKIKEGSRQINTRYIDPNYSNNKRISGTEESRSIQDSFADENLFFINAPDSVSQGHIKVQQALLEGRLKIFNTCTNTIYGFEHYVWDDHKTGDKDPKEKPKDKNKDFMDCVRYLMSSDIRFMEAVEETQDPLNTPKSWKRTDQGVGYAA